MATRDTSAAEPPTSALSQSLERGLRILSAFARPHAVLGVADIAREVELSKSTAYRYAATLTSMQFLQQDPETKKYELGPRALDLGFAAISSMELTRVAGALMQTLADTTGYTVSMAVLDGADIVYVDRRRCGHATFRMELNLQVGARLPAYCTSLGKVLLASRERAALKQILDRTDLARRGPKTITAREQLVSSLSRVRQTGLATNDEELAPGLRSIAAPVMDRTGTVVAAVSIVVPLTTWNASMEAVTARLEGPLRRTTSEISERMGFRPL